MKQYPTLPSDDDIRRLLARARTNPDPRASAVVTLMLYLTVRLSDLRHLKWEAFDSKAGALYFGENDSAVTLTELIIHQLLRVKATTGSKTIFGKPTQDSPTIDLLLRTVLDDAGLNQLGPDSLTRWSACRNPSVRRSVAKV